MLSAGIALIERDGIRQLTMQRLGAELGVQGMALYRHVHSRDDLLDGIVESMVDELLDDPDLQQHTDNWREYLHRQAHAVRRLALTHPQVFPLIATRSPAAPWLRPPLRSLTWADNFLGTLAGAGFTDRAAAEAYRAFASFLLGYLMLEVSSKGADTAPVDQADPREPGDTDLDAYPHLRRLTAELAEDFSTAEFEEALDALTDRLETVKHRTRPRR